MCGEKLSCQVTFRSQLGSPPHVRGKESHASSLVWQTRITPACAGKSSFLISLAHATWDHPRMCGEKLARIMQAIDQTGSPPHVRGKVLGKAVQLVQDRITPACAGKRSGKPHRGDHGQDHPRMCGEKLFFHRLWLCPEGSPPHVRGKD